MRRYIPTISLALVLSIILALVLSIMAVLVIAPIPVVYADSGTFYPDANPETTSTDGWVTYNNPGSSWATIHDAPTGTATYDYLYTIVVGFYADTSSNEWNDITRGILTFDISSVPSDKTIASTTLSLYGTEKKNTGGNSPTWNIYAATPASSNGLVNEDYDQIGTTAYCDTALTYAAFSTSGYNDFDFNATGLAAVTTAVAGDNILKLGIREATYDVADSPPPWGANDDIKGNFHSAEHGTQSYRPRLVVTWIVAPTVTTQAATSIEETTATAHGTITDTGDENCTTRGFKYGLTETDTWDEHEDGDFGAGAYSLGLTSLSPGTLHYVRAYATNSEDTGYGSYVSFTTKPAAPTNVSATDGDHTDKVVITWTKSTGATQYQVYRDGSPLGWLGDVATHDDTGAGAPTITPGSAVASDGSSAAHVALSLSGAGTNNGSSHVYKVRAKNATGESSDSSTDNGYRGVGSLTYQWYRSSGDADSDYSTLSGATSSTHNDTTAPIYTVNAPTSVSASTISNTTLRVTYSGASVSDGAGRYYKCYLSATGASSQYSASNRGYRDDTLAASDGYEIFSDPVYNGSYSTSEGLDTASPFDDTSLDPGITKYYKVKAKSAAGNWSALSSDYGGATTKPNAPSGLTASNATINSLDLSWTKGTGATYTEIRGKTGDYPANVTDGTQVYYDTESSAVDGGLDAYTMYYYRAWSYTSPNYSDTYSQTTGTTLSGPSTVTTQTPTNIEETTATGQGTITDTGGANCTTRGFKYGLAQTDTWDEHEDGNFTTGAFSLGLTGLSPGTAYYIRAYATNPGGTAYGSWISFTTKPNAPTGLASSNPTLTTVDLTWTKGSGASYTEVRRKEAAYPANVSDGTRVYLGTEASTTDTGLAADTTYGYRAWSYTSPNYSDTYSQTTGTTLTPGDELLVSTLATTVTASTSATFNGEIILTGNCSVTKRGFDWGPTQTAFWTSEVTGTFGVGTYTLTRTDLEADELYYVRFWAEDCNERKHGDWQGFITEQPDYTELYEPGGGIAPDMPDLPANWTLDTEPGFTEDIPFVGFLTSMFGGSGFPVSFLWYLLLLAFSTGACILSYGLSKHVLGVAATGGMCLTLYASFGWTDWWLLFAFILVALAVWRSESVWGAS